MDELKSAGSPAGGRPEEDRDPPATRRVLVIASLALFATSLFMRAIDPVIPKIAADLATDTRTVALLSTAYALPYALIQPLLGSVGDTLGKSLVLKASLLMTALSGLVGALAPDFSVLLASRIMTGAVSGGIFPIALAIAGDLVPVHRRQIAFGRLLAAAMLGNLLGSPLAGVVADLAGWRGIFGMIGAFALFVFVITMVGFRGLALDPKSRFDLVTVASGYRAVFRNPLAKICFGAVFLEGVLVFGFFPYVAALLAQRGEARATIAGLVIAGFAIGGFVYSASVAKLLGRLGEPRLMVTGSVLMATGLITAAVGVSWPVDFGAFAMLGLGFYSLHGVIQIYVTELAPAARGLAMALHSSSFFLGQALGPVVYRFGIEHAGVLGSNTLAAAVLIAVGLVCAARLRRKPRDGSEKSTKV